MKGISLLKMAIFSRHCPFSDDENHQGQCQKIARGEAIFRETNEMHFSETETGSFLGKQHFRKNKGGGKGALEARIWSDLLRKERIKGTVTFMGV